MNNNIIETPEQLTRTSTYSATASGTGEVLIAVRSQPAAWLRDAINRLDEMTQLKPNWDSYGAAPVDGVAIQFAYQLLRCLSRVHGIERPSITATPNGQVGLSWDDGTRSMDLDINSRGRIAYYYEGRGDERESETSNVSEVVELLTRF